MIVSHSLRYVYVGPPKTGSTTVHKWLTQPVLFDPARDMDTSKSGHQHSFKIPESARDYFIFVTTRERNAWLDSLWRQSRNDAVDYDDGLHPLMSWQEFLAWRPTCGNPFYDREIKDYFPHRIDLTLHLETLEADVQKLPFYTAVKESVAPLIHHNYNRRTPKGTPHD